MPLKLDETVSPILDFKKVNYYENPATDNRVLPISINAKSKGQEKTPFN